MSQQIRIRIILSVAAYAYEYENNPVMSDQEYDALSYKVDTSIKPGRKDLDAFLLRNFEPATGMWIRLHPELLKVKQLYWELYGGSSKIQTTLSS